MPKGYKKDGTPCGRGAVMNVTLGSSLIDGHDFVNWTCPKCGHRNMGIRWFGRDKYICASCEEWTDIKGATSPAIAIAV
jgi:predicted RNA-binding Zn-ribbon protein involved in translation (DUF1610 family)